MPAKPLACNYDASELGDDPAYSPTFFRTAACVPEGIFNHWPDHGLGMKNHGFYE